MVNIFKNYRVNSIALFLLFLLFLTTGCSILTPVIPATGCQKRVGLNPEIEAAIDQFRTCVPAMMKKGNVPGASIALVDDKGIIWTEGFGYTSQNKKKPVTPDTLFLICSMSKTFVATAAMLAVQDGLVDLDEPITTYLPEFKVNSRYEKNPEDKITLRMQLSHTSGLPREATIGNCFAPEPIVSLEQHVKSIYGTWLLFPVGKGYRYSNVGIDVAAYIIEVVSGMPYEQYLRERVFDAIGMHKSTTDSNQILSDSNRAIGHEFGFARMPVVIPMIPSGQIYSNAKELARFVQIHINSGVFEDERILEEDLIDTMNRPRGKVGKNIYYGLGIMFVRQSFEGAELALLAHQGLGAGFSSVMCWLPEYDIGLVVLSNKGVPLFSQDLASTLTKKLIKDKIIEKHFVLPKQKYPECVPKWDAWPEHKPTRYKSQWRKYCGKYCLRVTGYELEWWVNLARVLCILPEDDMPCLKVYEKEGFLCLKLSRFLRKIEANTKEVKLQEYEPGLFFAPTGEALDFRSEVPTWQNYRLKKN